MAIAPHPTPVPTRAAAVTASGRPGSPLGADRVRLTGGLLHDWQRRNRTVTVPHVVREVRGAGNLDNFRRLADPAVGDYRGRYPFLDTDVYKTLEGLAYELAREPEDAGEADAQAVARDFYEESVALIERAQRPDGYLGTFYQSPQSPKEPWQDLSWGHEMYNLGHLAQAAVAASRQLGDRRLLDVAARFADLVVERYGPEGEPAYCGHPEVEMALVELARETGDRRYLEQARLFVERRGAGTLEHTIFAADYFQDAVPLRELGSVTGHAVRMVYLAAGATDVALETGDAALVAHLERLWDDMVARKSYLTGGIGSRHSDEAFGDRFELPGERAYAETCAAIGTLQWGWRLFLATGRADVLDHLERVLHNAFAVGLSEDGAAFFYDNPLQRRPDHEQRSGAEKDGELLRRAWFGCPCCPPNVVRWMSELQDHLAVADDDSLTLALYASVAVSSPAIDVDVETDLPWHGRVAVHVRRATDDPATLVLRVPAWADGAAAAVDGVAVPERPTEGWLRLTRAWRSGQTVTLDLPMPVRAVTAHPHLDAARGTAAVLRGPLVYCVEQQDSPAPVDDLLLAAEDVPGLVADDDHPWHVLRGALAVAPPAGDDPYPPLGAPAAPATDRAHVALVPYALWGNREAGAMRVFLRLS
ncbi:glycoside hydrolase family 127 protein [Isoptericola sp. NPDC057653]|uniref:glycoside hydrolase family 127 protein n=1 Tax=Isoptericola sp. NPDC057653 TaxID=3346195 RepID=UPI0036C1B2F0